MDYRIDFFSGFIFLGIVQGIFLLFFFLSKENRQRQANRFYALMLISIVACILEIFLMYTGYIIHVLHLVDFSETFALLIGPSLFLIVISLIHGHLKRKHYWHFAFPLVYLLFQIPFLLLPTDAKYNAYIAAFRPDLPPRSFDMPYESNLFFLTEHHTELVLASLLIYTLLSLVAAIRAFQQLRESFWRPKHPILKSLQLILIKILSSSLVILLVKLFNERDLGDHILAAYIAVTIYMTSFSVIRQSGFFKQATLNEQPIRYKSSSLTLTEQEQLLARLAEKMKQEKPFRENGFSLPDLAKQLNVSVHVLSQAINGGLQKSFFEMTAHYRIEEAQRLLKEQPNIKVEEIAEQVGYNSKSSFNQAFKKITGKTPGEFRQLTN